MRIEEKHIQVAVSILTGLGIYGIYASAGDAANLPPLQATGISLAGNWLSASLAEGIRRYVKADEWMAPRPGDTRIPATNGHLQLALKAAYAQALEQVVVNYVQEREADEDTEKALQDFVSDLSKLNGKKLMDEMHELLNKEAVFSYTAGSAEAIREEFQRHLLTPGAEDACAEAYGLPADFFPFLYENLPSEIQHFFRNAIKKGGEAHIALELVYQEEIRRQVAENKDLLVALNAKLDSIAWLPEDRDLLPYFRAATDDLLAGIEKVVETGVAKGFSSALAQFNLPQNLKERFLHYDIELTRLRIQFDKKGKFIEAKQAKLENVVGDDLQMLKDEMQMLDQERLRLSGEINQITRIKAQDESDILALYEQIAKRPSDSALVQQATALVEAGDLKGALALLTPERLHEKAQDLAYLNLLRAKMLLADKSEPNWYAEAEAAADRAFLHSEGADPQMSFDVGSFFQQLKAMEKALKSYETALLEYQKLANTDPDSYLGQCGYDAKQAGCCTV